VFSGMLASTLLAVAFVPVFFVLIGPWQSRCQAAQPLPRGRAAPAGNPDAPQ
jgi:hypothetical protein